ncbi:MAG: biopolymer transporter ExbD, partial [Planctomycetota bacterium]|nr:biopolymer transporter ExbD [Planctomycetota bacterium]
PNPRIVINITRSGQLLISGRRVSAAQIEDQLAEHLKNNWVNVEVRIRSDRQIPFLQVRPVMLACAKMGIWNVSFSVYPTDGG